MAANSGLLKKYLKWKKKSKIPIPLEMPQEWLRQRGGYS